MIRRAFLRGTVGAAGLTSLSGCLFLDRGPGGGFDLYVTEIAGRNLVNAFVTPKSELSPAQASVVVDLEEDAAAVGYGDRWFSDGEFVRVEGSYFRISVGSAGEGTVRRPALRVVEVTESEADGEAVPLDEYGGADYDAVRRAVITEIRGDRGHHVFFGPPERTPQLRPEIEHEYVEHQDRYFRLAIAEEEVEARKVEYAWETVSADGDELEALIREERDVVEISAEELSDEERAILENALVDKYSGALPYSDAEKRVFDLLNVSPKSNGVDERVFRYDGRYHRAEISWWHSD